MDDIELGLESMNHACEAIETALVCFYDSIAQGYYEQIVYFKSLIDDVVSEIEATYTQDAGIKGYISELRELANIVPVYSDTVSRIADGIEDALRESE